jgi:glycosyltransferase involved in cell wall biosynthesis
MRKLSVIVPVFNEMQSLEQLHLRLRAVLERLGTANEIIFVDDGSTDASQKVIKEIIAKDSCCKGIFLRKNFGKSRALQAGFRHISGDLIITMDADLQDDPEDIPAFIEQIDAGYDLVTGWKKDRNDPFEKRVASRIFNSITASLSGISLHDFNCGFKAYTRSMVDSIDVYGELHRYIPVLAHTHGFKIAEIAVTNHKRPYGKSKFGLERYLRGFFDSITTTFLSRFNDRPMYLFGTIGLVFFLIGLAICVYLTIEWFKGFAIGTRPLLTLGILLMILGVQSFSTGLIGNMLVDATYRQTYRESYIRELVGFSTEGTHD